MLTAYTHKRHALPFLPFVCFKTVARDDITRVATGFFVVLEMVASLLLMLRPLPFWIDAWFGTISISKSAIQCTVWVWVRFRMHSDPCGGLAVTSHTECTDGKMDKSPSSETFQSVSTIHISCSIIFLLFLSFPFRSSMISSILLSIWFEWRRMYSSLLLHLHSEQHKCSKNRFHSHKYFEYELYSAIRIWTISFKCGWILEWMKWLFG